jgi:hypothetical protein
MSAKGCVVELVRISGGDCGNGDCPTIYRTDRGTLAVQGYRVIGIETPDDETVVEIPLALFWEAADALGR